MIGTLPTPADCATCTPFMNQIATLPLVSCQRRSLLPLPSKSPVSTTDQLVGAEPTPAALRNLRSRPPSGHRERCDMLHVAPPFSSGQGPHRVLPCFTRYHVVPNTGAIGSCPTLCRC